MHAARYIALAKKPAVIAQVFAGDAAALDARERAIVAFSEKLSACPPAATAEDAAALREQGLSDGEIFDLVLSVAAVRLGQPADAHARRSAPAGLRRMRVAILGAGSIALGMAALLCREGHEPVLWSPSGAGTAALAAGAPLQASGAVEGRFGVAVARSCAEAVAGAGAVVVAVPGYGHRRVIEECAPHLADGQVVIISSHMSFGALHLRRCCPRAPILVAWGTTVVSGRRAEGAEIRVSHVRRQVDLAVLPHDAAARGMEVCIALFGERFRDRGSLVAIALSNLNPQNHLAIGLCNFTRMEKGERWRQYANTTEAVGRLMQALDDERLAIARAFGVAVRTLGEHFSLSFGASGATMGEMAADLAQRGADPYGPATLETRYITEDVPFGLWPTIRLAQLAGIGAPLHEAGLRLFSALHGRDFAAENDLLPRIEPLGEALDGVGRAVTA